MWSAASFIPWSAPKVEYSLTIDRGISTTGRQGRAGLCRAEVLDEASRAAVDEQLDPADEVCTIGG